VCIGSSFAFMESLIVIVSVLQRYRPRLVPGQVVEIEPRISLRPRGGLPMTLEPAA
jgi:cytochrome P450